MYSNTREKNKYRILTAFKLLQQHCIKPNHLIAQFLQLIHYNILFKYYLNFPIP